MERLRADSVVLENLSRVAREIGFDRVRPYVMENGSYKALPDMPFSQWENPYFTVDSPEQGDTFTIYQLKGGSETRDYRFEPYESLQEAGLAIDRQNYDLVYTAPLDGKTTLEDIFRTFNLDRPPDFTGHSLSVSDIVVLNRGGDTKAYYCDSAGFVDVPSFLEQKMETAVDQLIFSDLATPSTGEWNVYDDIRDKLIAKGIPKEQIAFIHDANTDAKKATLFAKVRAGKVRILMGSTQKMGAGTNVQTKLIALHHLDVPWRPSDIEQREGRILRQGNENPSVQIYRYATEGSFDAYSWQLIENKQKFISQIMTSKSPARSCQDLDEVALSYAEIKALCAGNPLIKEKMELDNEVARLSTLRSSHMSQIFELQDKIAIGYPASIQKVEESLDAVSKDIDVYRANSRFNPDGSEKFSAIVMGTTYTERKAADAALRDALQGATAGDVIIGQYRGFNIHAYYDAKAVSFMGYLQGEQKYNFEFNPKENFSSFRHLLEKLSDTQALDQERLTILNKNLEDAKEAVNQPFAYEKEFQTKLARLNELNTVLNQEGGRTDMHPEIQALLTKIDQTYTAMVTDPQKYLDYLTFRGQCVGMGAENSVAVFAQNPKATYCPAPEALGSPNVKSGEEDHFVSVLRSDGIERVYALEQYDLPESEYLCRCSNGQRKAFPSFSHMATVLHMAIGTVQTAIKSLMAAGRLLKAAFRAGKHNLYILVETVAQALPGANPGAQKENRRAGTRRQKIEMLLASIASLISNSKILHEIGACQEVLLVFLKRVCQNLRNSNKTNPTYSTKERYFSLSKLAIGGEVRLSELPEPAAEVGVHGKVPFIQAEGFRVCSAFRAHGLPDRCARLFFSLYCHYSRCHQRR